MALDKRKFAEGLSRDQQLAEIWQALGGGGFGPSGPVGDGTIGSTSVGNGTAQGAFHAFPANNANGAELTTGRPIFTDGIRIEMADTATLSYFIAPAGSAPGAPPAIAKSVTADGPTTIDEPLSGTDAIFMVSKTGTVFWRWIQR